MESPTLIVHRDIIGRFVRLHEHNRLAHAYLFVGPRDIGKHQTALGVAKWVNCESSAKSHDYFCDQCSSCLKINNGNHPDVHVLDVEAGESIKIENIRELLSQIKLRPFFAERKIFILKNIEVMTDEGANALLKTLEEPTASSLLLLTTSVPENVLDTVKSRCHTIHFFPTDHEALAQDLIKHYDEDAFKAHFFAYYSHGAFGQALKLREGNFFERKNVIIDKFMLSVQPNDAFVKEVLADKVKTKEFLDVLLSWIRDAFLVKAGLDDGRLIHLDRLKDLKNFAMRLSFDDLVSLNKEMIGMSKMLAENLNLKIPLLIIKERLYGTNH